MLYNNICMIPPTTDRPATASLIPNAVGPAALLLDDDGLPVPVTVPLGLRVAGSLVAGTQAYCPSISPLDLSFWKAEQSISDVLCILKAPATFETAGREGVVKFPDISTAPPTVVKSAKLML